MSFQLPPSPLFHMIIFKDENEPLLESEAGDVEGSEGHDSNPWGECGSREDELGACFANWLLNAIILYFHTDSKTEFS